VGAAATGRQVVGLRGGLGNQLFQLSYALYLARQGHTVGLDVSCVRHGVPDIVHVPLVGDRAQRLILPMTRFMPSPAGRFGRMGRLPRRAIRPRLFVLDESPQGPEPSVTLPPAWRFGYWQRLTYAEALIPLLRTGLATAKPYEKAGPDRSVVARLHVRRGDYAGNAMELSPDWYRRSLAVVYDAAGAPIDTEVVTNDPDWCRRHLDLGGPYRVLPTGTPLDDLRSLAASDFLVTSRSTFSWWAAAVSDATVVAPDPWFPETSPGGCLDLLPGNWLTCPA
jgi:hypothetical protein